MPVNLENSPVAKQDWKMSVFSPISKNSNNNECSNYCIIVLISHASKIMLKILQASLQQYMNWEPPDIQADLEKAEAPEIKLAICWIIEKASLFQENIYFCFIDYAKAFDWVEHNKLKNS